MTCCILHTKYLRISFIITIALLSNIAVADGLKEFTSDGCSSFPDGTVTQKQLWLACCTAHDLAYWKGGTYAERLAADMALKQCVAKVGQEEIATIMLLGVRVGGTPYLPTQFRWGYGWPWPRGYRELSDKERESVAQLMGDNTRIE